MHKSGGWYENKRLILLGAGLGLSITVNAQDRHGDQNRRDRLYRRYFREAYENG